MHIHTSSALPVILTFTDHISQSELSVEFFCSCKNFITTNDLTVCNVVHAGIIGRPLEVLQESSHLKEGPTQEHLPGDGLYRVQELCTQVCHNAHLSLLGH